MGPRQYQDRRRGQGDVGEDLPERHQARATVLPQLLVEDEHPGDYEERRRHDETVQHQPPGGAARGPGQQHQSGHRADWVEAEDNLGRGGVTGVLQVRTHVINRPDDLTPYTAQQGQHQRQPAESVAPYRVPSRVAGTCRREHQTWHRHRLVKRSNPVGALPPEDPVRQDQRHRDTVKPQDQPTDARRQPESPPRITRPALHSRSARSPRCENQKFHRALQENKPLRPFRGQRDVRTKTGRLSYGLIPTDSHRSGPTPPSGPARCLPGPGPGAAASPWRRRACRRRAAATHAGGCGTPSGRRRGRR